MISQDDLKEYFIDLAQLSVDLTIRKDLEAFQILSEKALSDLWEGKRILKKKVIQINL